LEPWLFDVLAQREVRFATPSAPFELLAISLAFIPVIFGAIWAAFKMSFALHLPTLIAHNFAPLLDPGATSGASPEGLRSPEPSTARENERAQRTIDRIAALDRHELSQAEQTRGSELASPRTSALAAARDDAQASPPSPLGQSYRRMDRRVTNVATRKSIAS
jgi:type IV secretion system protein VirB6